MTVTQSDMLLRRLEFIGTSTHFYLELAQRSISWTQVCYRTSRHLILNDHYSSMVCGKGIPTLTKGTD